VARPWHRGAVFDTVFGLPVHALVMHVVVVLVPLAAAGVVAIAVVPRWRPRFGILVVLLATAGLAAVPVATRSGGELEDRVGASGVVAEQINDHQRYGELVLWPTLVMWVLAVVLVLLDRQRRGTVVADTGPEDSEAALAGDRGRSNVTTAVAVLAVLAALTSATLVTVTGHLGATAVWSCTLGSDACT
jgi:preprotein translocase subunit SecG